MKLIILLLLALSTFSQGKMRICAEAASYPPYVPIDGSGGILLDLIQSIDEQTELDIEVIRIPWKRCLQMLELNEVQGAFAAIWTAERDKIFAFPKTRDGELNRAWRMWTVNYPIFTYQDAPLTWQNGELNNVQNGLAAPAGYVAMNMLKDLGYLYAENISLTDGMKMVSMQRLDGYIVEEAIGTSHILSAKYKNITTPFAKPFLSSDWYVPLSKTFVEQQPEQAMLFWQTLENVREQQGQQLIETYWPKPVE